ncbi:hypothetical protein HYS97_00045 [Candidatus Daviesbacteria bacterium]|nr:hypothetical protein [Candidatus Daviesbacteria bacterium]
MFKKTAALITSGSWYLYFAVSAYAQNKLIAPPKGSVGADIKVTDLTQLIIQWIFYIAIFLAVVYLMFGGIRWITSRGDKQAVESARKHIVSAVIGLVVVLGAFFVINILFTVLGGDNPLKKGFELPTLKNVNQ